MLRRRIDPAAGRSVAEYYERRLRAWRRSMRAPFAFAVLWTGGLAYPMWRWAPHGELFAGVLIGSCVGMISWIRDEPPEFIAKWKRGADGERHTARVLRRLESAGWFATHDRTTGRGNIDHVVVGPGGIFLLETKNLSGTVSVEEHGLTAVYGEAAVDSFTNQRLAGVMRGSAAALKQRVEAETEIRRFVHAVVVIWGDFTESLKEHDRVTYITGDRLCDWLESRDEELSRREVSLIRLALEADVVVPHAPALGTPAS